MGTYSRAYVRDIFRVDRTGRIADGRMRRLMMRRKRLETLNAT